MMAADISSSQLEFFEKKVRPVFEEHCYKCHSESSKKVKGKLLLDSKAGWVKGGDSGKSVIVPGKPEESLLVKMIHHLPDYEEMPTKYKMKGHEIKAIEDWIKMGAPDPRTKEIAEKFKKDEFNLEERKKWWAFQAVQNPAVPTVKNTSWSSNNVDKFILEKLEEKNWQPAPKTDKRTLIRRITFDLTGLPPTQQEVNDFLADKSPKAFEKVVDRLLASPHYGEQWARHWMDVVRYAETKAFEADYTMPHVFQYRDYLIRALNEDVPYDRFIKEALAGDLIPPRFNKQNGNNESLSGTGYVYLTDGQHGPPDIHGDEARVFDGIIDVVTKAFTGMTVACARCHDHKFDAITAADYYSLYGIMSSSRFEHANIASPVKQKEVASKLQRMKPLLVKEYIRELAKDLKNIANYIKALRGDQNIAKGLDKKLVENLKKLSKDQKKLRNHNGLKTFFDLVLSKDDKKIIGYTNRKPNNSQKDFYGLNQDSFGQLLNSGLAFGTKPSQNGDVIFATNGSRLIQSISAGEVTAGTLSSRQAGTLRTPDFIIDGKPITLFAKGKNATVHLIVRNYEQVGKGPTTNRLRVVVNSDSWKPVTFHSNLWKGEKAYIEVIQNGASFNFAQKKQYHYRHNEDSYVALRGTVGYNDANAWSGFKATKASDIPAAMTKYISSLLSKWYKGELNSDEVDLLTSFLNVGLLKNSTAISPEFKKKIDLYRSVAQQMPKPVYVRSLAEGTSSDEPVYIRGNHKTLSHEKNPRHFLDGIDSKAFNPQGSGRLEWANALVQKDNPLTARVMVNRLWHHIFGRGLVFSTNNFGKLGTMPSHPELLDYLAQDFMKNGWSVKKIIRKMVLTSTYKMSSTPGKGIDKADPENELLQHMPVKRLTAEMIRDNILATSGTLDKTMFGPSIAANVNGMPNSRAKPGKSGPVDGAGRRSVYQELRRNYLPPFFMAFDMPNATESIGKRNITNVPAQSLALMNDEFVQLQAKRWATKYAAETKSIRDKVNAMHQEAFARPATQEELVWAEAAVKDIAGMKKLKINSPELWQEFCHIMINRKEFIYLF
ncbi:MAG: PSD1 and planctomycete cytochrome C domain-containing protein [Lentisphaerales bacterium]|nr:PSD1 and planctomycete cytochrome C domain-containing protein [Lentisphaerales bacterium]